MGRVQGAPASTWHQDLSSPRPAPPGAFPKEAARFSPSSPPAPPVILGETEELVEEVTVNANSTVSLHCPVLGNPAPTISWLQNGLPFSPSPRLQVLENGRILQVRATPPQPLLRLKAVADFPGGPVVKTLPSFP